MKINSALSYSFLYNIINAFFPLLTLPFVFRSISPEVYGTIVYSTAIYQSLVALLFLSLTSYSIREYKNKSKVGLEKIYTLQFFFVLIAIILYVLISFVLEAGFDKVNKYELFYLSCLLSYSIYSDWIFFAEQNYKSILKRNIILKSILLILVVLLVHSNDDVYIYVGLLSLSIFGHNILSFFISKKVYKNSIVLKYKLIIPSLLEAKYFMSSSMVGIFYQYLDQVFVSIALGNTSATYLSLYKQITAVLSMMSSTYCRFNMPLALSVYSNNMKGVMDFHRVNIKKYMMLIVIITVSFITLGKPSLEIFAGDKFEILTQSIFICALLFISSSIAVYIDMLHSVPLFLERITFKANIIVLTVYFLLFTFLSKSHGYNGIIFALFIAEVVGILFVISYYLKRNHHVRR